MKKLKLFITLVILILSSVYITNCKKDKTPMPGANFSFTGDNRPAPCEVSFSDSSTNAISYYWKFGDGTTSSEQNPKHIYATGGSFDVRLTATGEGGIASITKSVVIKNSLPNPVANFTITGDNNFAPCKVSFTNTSINANSYTWDFGDGSTSSEQTPIHVYNQGGTYNVTLTAKNESGVENLINKTATIKNVPTALKIKSIELISIPFTDSSGNPWDALGLPDLYVKITDVSGTNYLTTLTYNDVSPSQLPVTYTLTTPFIINTLDFNFIINCYDEDYTITDKIDDLIGGLDFKASNSMPANGDQYPVIIEVSSSSNPVKYKLNVEWME